MRKVLFASNLTRSSDFYPLFTELTRSAKKAGFELKGMSFGIESADDVGLDVAYIPAPACLSYARLMDPPNFKGRENEVKPFYELAAFEPKRVEKHGVERIAAILMNLHVYFRDYLIRKKIEFVILGHQFAAPHQVVLNVCKELGMKVLFHHPGVLHGTHCFETRGQMAESSLFDRWEEIVSNPLSVDDLELADRYLDRLRSGALKRPGKQKISKHAELNVVKNLKAQGKPVVVYAGVLDFRTGICPESYEGARKHSPWAKSNLDGLRVLVEETEGSNVRIIYKPHPLWEIEDSSILTHPRVFTVENILISNLMIFSDALVTICSTSAYEALTAHVPVVLLGEMQASLCDSVRQVKSREELKKTLYDSLNNPIRPHDAFREHVAYLLRDYLFQASDRIKDLPMRKPLDFWEALRDSPPLDLVIEETRPLLPPLAVGYPLKGLIRWGSVRSVCLAFPCLLFSRMNFSNGCWRTAAMDCTKKATKQLLLPRFRLFLVKQLAKEIRFFALLARNSRKGYPSNPLNNKLKVKIDQAESVECDNSQEKAAAPSQDSASDSEEILSPCPPPDKVRQRIFKSSAKEIV